MVGVGHPTSSTVAAPATFSCTIHCAHVAASSPSSLETRANHFRLQAVINAAARYTRAMPSFLLLGVLAVVALFVLISRHANEVFCLSVRRGRGLLIRGRIPGGLQVELLEVLRRAGVHDAVLRAVREGGRARLQASGEGVNEAVLQRLRNVFGTRLWRDLKLGPPPRHRNLGQRLGWTWLAWRLHGEPRDDLRVM